MCRNRRWESLTDADDFDETFKQVQTFFIFLWIIIKRPVLDVQQEYESAPS